MKFEDMMEDLNKRLRKDECDEIEYELREVIPPMVTILRVVKEEMLEQGFSERESFDFAKDYILLMFELGTEE